MRSGEEHPRFLGHPDGSNKQVNRALEKRRMIAFNPVTQEQEHPPANEESATQNPLGKKEQDQPGENHRDAYSMQQLVPAGRVFVIVLRHVVRQTQSAPPCGDDTADTALYTEFGEIARAGAGISYRSRRPSIAFSMVTSSAYSRSAPTGMPTPMRVTRTPSGFRSFDMYTAVPSPWAVGLVAMIISSTPPPLRRSIKDLSLSCSGPRPCNGESEPPST